MRCRALIKCYNKSCNHNESGECLKPDIHIREDLQCADYSKREIKLDPEALKGIKIEVFGRPDCPACKQLKKDLNKNNIPYTYLDVQQDDLSFYRLLNLNIQVVPVTLIDNTTAIIGSDYEEVIHQLHVALSKGFSA
jgi:glutaredoxin